MVWHSDGVCLPGEPPHHSLATVDLSGRLSLSLSFSLSLTFIKEGFSFGNLRKSSEPITAVRQATREIRGSKGLYWAASALWTELNFSALRLYSPQLLTPSLFKLSLLFKISTCLERSKISQWKGKFLFKLYRYSGRGNSLVTSKAWRRNFLTCPEAPNVAKSWIPPAP
jgi:hypothetical protein